MSDDAAMVLLGTPGYKRVAKDVMPDGKVVSTVWLGLDHRYGGGVPVIFETTVFASETSFEDLYCDRYHTEGRALEGHRRIVERLRDGSLLSEEEE